MNRIGHASSPNSAMNWIRSPRVTAPTETRHDPTAMSATAPTAGSASSAGSNPARMYPAWTRSCCSARAFHGEPLGLLGFAPERLHDHRAVDALVGDGGHVADPLLRPAGRSLHPAREAPIHQRQGGEQQDADHREVDVGREQRDHREQHQEEHAGGERDRVQHVDRRLDVGLHVRDQLAGRRLLVELERQVPVAVGDPRAERRHDARPRDAAVVPANHDAARAQRARGHDRGDREPDLRRRHAAVERGLQDVVHRAPQRDGQSDRCQRVHHRAAHRDQERAGVRLDVRHDQTQAAQEQAALSHLRCLDVGLHRLSSAPTRHPTG